MFETRTPQSYDELEDLLKNDESIRKLHGTSDPLPGEEEGEEFFRTGLHGPHGTTLVFASQYMMDQCLATSTKAKLDATFKVLPRKPSGRQLLTLHACHGTNVSQFSLLCFRLISCHNVTVLVSFVYRHFQSFMLLCSRKRRLHMCNSWST